MSWWLTRLSPAYVCGRHTSMRGLRRSASGSRRPGSSDPSELVASVRKRVEGGAEAPFEAALVVGEMQRSHSESDGARSVLGEAWSALRALADLPAEPQTLASPGMPELNVPADVESKFEAGVLRRAVAHRGSLESAFLGLEQAQRRSRWSATATLGREADDLIATVGASYRFPSRGEGPALDREHGGCRRAAINRGAEAGGRTSRHAIRDRHREGGTLRARHPAGRLRRCAAGGRSSSGAR